jgi:2-dehydro-3-deoxyglucarate aldolase
LSHTKEKLAQGKPTLGGWMLIGHPIVAELLAGEGFDWICVDMEHAAIGYETFQNIAMALKGAGCDLFARLQACDAAQAKHVLDAGAHGIIVPSVNTREQAEMAVAIAMHPPKGIRGASFARATDYGRNFQSYYHAHNDNVIVVAMLEHIDAVKNVDAILTTPGIDAIFIGPYDLSASMGLAGQLDHPEVRQAQETILQACEKHGVPPGLHVVAVDGSEIRRQIERGHRFIACSLDTQFVIHSAREVLREIKDL